MDINIWAECLGCWFEIFVLFVIKISAKYEVTSLLILSRPYFKNDLFNFALKRENDKAR